MDGSIGRINRILKKRIIPENEPFVPREQNGFRQICIMTEGCNLGKCGSCTMCNYGFTDSGYDRPENLSKQILEGYDGKTILLGTSGSILDDKEFSNEDLMTVLKKVRKTGTVKNLILETSYRFVTKSKLKNIADALGDGIRVTIEMGLESSDPHVLRDCLNKSINEDEYRKAVGMIHAYGFSVSVNVLMGSPGLPYRTQIDDAEKTVRWADAMMSECGGADRNDDRIIIFPVNVKPGNLLYELEENGFYRVSPHIQILDLLSRFDGPLLDRIRLSWTYFDDGIMSDRYDFPGTCAHCREGIKKLYSEYSSCTTGRTALVNTCMNLTKKCTCRMNPQSVNSELSIGRISAEFIRPFRPQMNTYADRSTEFSELDELIDVQKDRELPIVGIIGAPLIGKRTLANRYAARIRKNYNTSVRMDLGWDDGNRPDIPDGCLLLIENLDAYIRVKKIDGKYRDRKKEIQNRLAKIIGTNRPGLVMYTGMMYCGEGECLVLNRLNSRKAFELLISESSKMKEFQIDERKLGKSMGDLKLTEPYAINSLAHIIDSDIRLDNAEKITEFLLTWRSRGRELNSQYAEETVKIAESSLNHDCMELMDMLCINNSKKDFTESFIAMCLNREFRSEAEILREMNLLRMVDQTNDKYLGKCYSLTVMNGFTWYGHIEYRYRWFEAVSYIYRGMAAIQYIGNNRYKKKLTRKNNRIILNLMDVIMDCIGSSGPRKKQLYDHIRSKTYMVRINPKIYNCSENHRMKFDVPDHFITSVLLDEKTSSDEILNLYDPRTYELLLKLKKKGLTLTEDNKISLEYRLKGTWPMLIPDYMFNEYHEKCAAFIEEEKIEKYIPVAGYDPFNAIVHHLWFYKYFDSALSYEVPAMHRAYNMMMWDLELKRKMRTVTDSLKNNTIWNMYDEIQGYIREICCVVNVLIDAIRMCIMDGNSYLDRLIENILEWGDLFEEWRSVVSDKQKNNNNKNVFAFCPAELHLLITYFDINSSIGIIKAEKPGLFPVSESVKDGDTPPAASPFIKILQDFSSICGINLEDLIKVQRSADEDGSADKNESADIGRTLREKIRHNLNESNVMNSIKTNVLEVDIQEITLSTDVFFNTVSSLCNKCGTYYSIQTLPGTRVQNKPFFTDYKECFQTAFKVIGLDYLSGDSDQNKDGEVNINQIILCNMHQNFLAAMVRHNDASDDLIQYHFQNTIRIAKELDLKKMRENAECSMIVYLMNKGDYVAAENMIRSLEKLVMSNYEAHTNVENRINEMKGDLMIKRDCNYSGALKHYEKVNFKYTDSWENCIIKAKMYRAYVNIPDMQKASKIRDELIIYLMTSWTGNYRLPRRIILDNLSKEIMI